MFSGYVVRPSTGVDKKVSTFLFFFFFFLLPSGDVLCNVVEKVVKVCVLMLMIGFLRNYLHSFPPLIFWLGVVVVEDEDDAGN